ncbi:hypothetical protein M595_2187 [Lyngbya aestuarii BL J]|uniref:Magnetosome protein MamS/MamX domain-containing protein n=2 Tax=Lyngbya aestuarii TaxID=118322 RepID=U7QIS2_9CYAN|nr:hypothetical protein M595_2187 [Lyngbya aestuarii BL J]
MMSLYFSAATILSAALIVLSPIDRSADSTFDISQASPPCCQSGRPGMMPGNLGGGYGRHRGMIFNSNEVETVTGKVLQVDTWTQGEWQRGGVHVVLQTDNETINLHLGPAWYINNQDIRIEPNDQIQVTGIRVTSGDGRAMMVVSEVSKGNQVITLRDVGFPTWMRGR